MISEIERQYNKELRKLEKQADALRMETKGQATAARTKLRGQLSDVEAERQRRLGELRTVERKEQRKVTLPTTKPRELMTRERIAEVEASATKAQSQFRKSDAEIDKEERRRLQEILKSFIAGKLELDEARREAVKSYRKQEREIVKLEAEQVKAKQEKLAVPSSTDDILVPYQSGEGYDLAAALQGGLTKSFLLGAGFGEVGIKEAERFLNENIQLASGEWIDKKKWERLTSEQQAEFKETGSYTIKPSLSMIRSLILSDKTPLKWEVSVETPTGTVTMPQAEWDKMSELEQWKMSKGQNPTLAQYQQMKLGEAGIEIQWWQFPGVMELTGMAGALIPGEQLNERIMQIYSQAEKEYLEVFPEIGATAVISTAWEHAGSPIFPARALYPDVTLKDITEGEWLQTALSTAGYAAPIWMPKITRPIQSALLRTKLGIRLTSKPFWGTTTPLRTASGVATGTLGYITVAEWENMTPLQQKLAVAGLLAVSAPIWGPAAWRGLKTIHYDERGGWLVPRRQPVFSPSTPRSATGAELSKTQIAKSKGWEAPKQQPSPKPKPLRPVKVAGPGELGAPKTRAEFNAFIQARAKSPGLTVAQWRIIQEAERIASKVSTTSGAPAGLPQITQPTGPTIWPKQLSRVEWEKLWKPHAPSLLPKTGHIILTREALPTGTPWKVPTAMPILGMPKLSVLGGAVITSQTGSAIAASLGLTAAQQAGTQSLTTSQIKAISHISGLPTAQVVTAAKLGTINSVLVRATVQLQSKLQSLTKAQVAALTKTMTQAQVESLTELQMQNLAKVLNLTEVQTKALVKSVTQLQPAVAEQFQVKPATELVTGLAIKPATELTIATKPITKAVVRTKPAVKEVVKPKPKTKTTVQKTLTKKIPIIVPLPGKEEEDEGKGKKKEYPDGTIVWKGGMVYKIIPPPYTLEKPITSWTPPVGMTKTEGTPQETLTFLGDKVPFTNVAFDLGVVDGYIDVKKKRIVFRGDGEETNVGKRITSSTKGITLSEATKESIVIPPKKKVKRNLRLSHKRRSSSIPPKTYLGFYLEHPKYLQEVRRKK